MTLRALLGTGLLLSMFVAGLAAASVPARAATIDVPVLGTRLAMAASNTNATPRKISFRSLDSAIVPPFSDPGLGASLLIFASNASGQCRAEVDLPAANWRAIGGDGPGRGWRYQDAAGGPIGIRSVIVRRGKIVIRGHGLQFPCGLEAQQQTLPVSVLLRLGDMRFCAEFGGHVRRNEPGHFRATDAAVPAACLDTDLTVATLNILHGLACMGDFCRQEERVVLAGQFIAARGCPDVVALQEVIDLAGQPSIPTAVQNHLLDVCPFPYEMVYLPTNIVDDSILLSRYPVLASDIRVLKNGFRNVLHARLDHPIGPVDVFSTHLASGSDGATNPCGVDCPPECVSAGAATVRDCQAVQTGLIVEELHDVATPAVLMGDFNSTPGSFVYQQFVDRGWSDAYLAAGNPECVPATGIGCTSGREDTNLSDLESPALNVNERIDYVFLVPPGAESLCAGALDSPADDDGDGTATRLFADVPNPFSPTCGPAPDPICWASDHDGVQADVNCQ